MEQEEKIQSEAEESQKVEENLEKDKDLKEKYEQLKKIQAGGDAAYAKAMKKIKELEEAQEKANLERMTDKERAEHLLSEKEKTLAQKEREVQEATLRFSIMKALSEKKMDGELADFVGGENEEVVIEKINKLDELIKIEVRKRVDETLSGTKKPVGGEPGGGGSLADKVKNMSMDELNKSIMGGNFKFE